MRKQLVTRLATTSLILLASTAARSQSAFFQAVTNLQPAAYWPLQETAPPPIADVETNLGSLGAAANAYYSSTNVFRGRPGAVSGDNSITFPGATGDFLAVPLTYPGVSVPVGPFTVEAWVLPTNYNGFLTIVGQAGANPGGINGTTNISGWVLSQNYLAYNDTSGTRGFSFHVYNGVGGNAGSIRGGAEADAAINYVTNGTTWYHLVGVFDGVNCTLYVNTATNYMTNQIAMTGSYHPDTWDPLTIGCGRGLNANLYAGGLDEVAIYTNALTANQVTNHFNASGSGYSTVVLGDSPYMYWRMNSPAVNSSSLGAYPVAANYGTVARLNGLYLSGTAPGLAGPPYAALGSPSYACGFNGMGTDATNGIPLFNNGVLFATNVASSGIMMTNLSPALNLISNNLTVMFWFKGNPEDSRFQTMLGHSDSSWRASLNQNGKVQFNPGEGGELTSAGVYNDGNWHLAAGVYANAGTAASGQNFLYVDGVLNASVLVTGTAAGSTTNTLLGGAPDYAPSGNGGVYRNRFFAGSLAHVAYFTNALSAAQIQALYWLANPPPAIQSQPAASVTNNAGATNLFSVIASGATNLAYQWYYNSSSSYSGATALANGVSGSGSVVSGSTSPTLTVNNLFGADSGYYFVVITNNYGSATSIISQLTVLTAPVITAQSPGGAFNLLQCLSTNATVSVSGGLPLSYQWFTNGVADSSAAGTGPIYAVTDVQPAQSGETFQCIVTNLYGAATNVLTTLTVTALPGGLPPSPYAASVVSLKPAAYYPLQETVQPPINDVEINVGSLGAAGNAVYSSVNAAKGFTGVTGDGDTAVNFYSVQNGGNGRFLAVPMGNPGVVLPAGPFAVEAWVYPTSYGREGIVAQSGPIGSGGLNGSANSAGWSLTENDVPSLNSSTVGWSFHVYNASGSTGAGAGAEAAIITPYPLNQWYHIVGVFDGVNCTLYVNGTNMTALAAGSPANTMVLSQPMTGAQALDTWDPLTIGCARGLNNNDFTGYIDEVAIYTNALTQTQVQNHYAAVSGASYATTVAGDQPYMYWRMDAPAYTAPDQSTYPVANNYGSVGNINTVNGTLPALYGTATQPGVPGPQFAGLVDPSSGNNNSYATRINGLGGANGGTANVNIGYNPGAGSPVTVADSVPIDIGTNAALNPTTFANNAGYSLSLWFKANPNDNRYQNMCGHSDSSWRIALDGTGHVNFKPGNTGTQITGTRVISDSNWHHTVATWNSNACVLYVDGVLDTSVAGVTSETGSTNDIFIGGDSMYLNSGNGTYASSPSSGTAYAQRNFNGSLAHFVFFTNALTAAQIQSLYNAAAAPPAIITQPTTARVNPAPLYLFFGVTARGSAPLSYQWYFNSSSNYAGATALANDGVKYAFVNTLQMTVSNLVNSDSGYYFVVVSNNAGSVTSILASLSVNYAPLITATSPTNAISLYQGQTKTFSVTAISDLGLLYQWFTNGVADLTSGGSTYNVGPAQLAMNGETIQCIVSNAYGTATNTVTLAVLPLPAIPAALTNSVFGSNVLALHPTAYWPMHEVQAPLPASQRDMETNYGTLGQIANAFYGDWKVNNGAPSNSVVVHQSPGALPGGQTNTSALFTAAGGSYAVIPRTSPLTTIKAPFTLEAWVKPLNNSFGIILGVGNLTTNRGAVGNDAFGGFDWLWAGSANTFSITMRSGPSNTVSGTAGAVSTEPKTTPNYYPGQWYHLVTTYDGTNIAYYVNGVQDFLQNSSAAGLNPDTWHPLTIGGGRWTGGINNQFVGSIDELAVYTNLLPIVEIQKHYNDGISPSGTYNADVLADSPILYYRMDSPPYVEPPVSAWPGLTNYGSVGIQGVYRPSVAPGGGAGPSASGIPVAGLSANTAMQGDGVGAFADAGFDPAFNPIGNTPFSVAAWARANPADAADRAWQSFLGHSDSGWRLNIDGNGAGSAAAGVANLNFNAGPGGGADIGNNNRSPNSILNAAKAFINDGNWHYVTGTYDGSNSLAYVDGVLVESNFNATATTGTTVDLFLGGYPSATVYSDIPTATRNEANRMLAGSLCEAAFWNGVVLKTNQVLQLYNAAGVPPILATQPISASVNQNSAFTNTVTVSGGSTPFAYQWYENNLPRLGQTNASLILNPVQPGDASTNWYVVVTNNYSAVTSVVVSLTVYSVPTITQQPVITNLTLYAGGHANFAIIAGGAVPLHYQWYSNTVAIVNATNTSYALINAQPPNKTNGYYCVVTNAAGTATSLTITVAIIPVPALIPYKPTILADSPVGFWPLSEPDAGSGSGPNNGVVANDYWGGNSGIYTNVTLGQPGFNATVDTNGTAAQFGANQFWDGDVYGISTNVDFSATNGASNFSIEAWVKGQYQQTVDAGLVSKGYGSGGEQFNLDCGSGVTAANPLAHSFRFFVRDAGGATHVVNSSVNPNDTLWHHLVGVCDESNGVVTLYIDGLPAGTAAITSSSGILATPRSMLIGARPSNATTNANDFQFVGWIQDVAVYNYALNATQVLNHYYAGDIPALVVVSPTNAVAGEFGTATFTTVVIGTPAVGYQWYNQASGLPPTNAVSTTGATLVLTNVQASDSGNYYYLQVTNAFGTNQSLAASLTVISGGPQIYKDVQAQYFVMAGSSLSLPVTAYGTMPLVYQWQISDTNAVNWTNLADNSRISGSQSNVLTISNVKKGDAGDYQLTITNVYGGVSSTVANLIVGTLPISFNGNGVGWTASQSGTYTTPAVVNNLLTLTDGAGNEARSFFLQYPQYIGAFKASFTYQDVGGNGADGIAFCLQNDPRGAAALGGAGGSFSVSGITPSWELELNIYSGSANGRGYNLFTNGNNGANLLPGSINVASGDPINVTLTYAQGQMSLSFTDLVANTSFTTNRFVGDMTKVVNGSTAYVGFTGADGGTTSTQIITNFSFVSIPTEAIQLNGTNVVVSWPGAIAGYALQQNLDLTTTNWANVTNADNVLNQLHQVKVPAAGSNVFYRLDLQP